MKVSTLRLTFVAAAAALAVTAVPAHAISSSLSFESVAGVLGSDASYAGSIRLTGSTLTLRLETRGSTGYLTGVAFNAPEGAITGMTSAPDQFKILDRAGASPFGVYTHGASLGGSWQHGGNPAEGVAVGDSATFVYSLANDGYKATDFWSATCTKTEGCIPFAARFRGQDLNAHDKVAAALSPVPEPETYALMLAGIALVGFVARRRRPQ